MTSRTILNERYIGRDVPLQAALEAMRSRLMGRCRITDVGCWEYTGTIMPLGYGEVHFQGKSWRVHRLMYTIDKGPIPDGADILHSCDNPPCFNPDHLSPGDQLQNVLESVERGRHHKVILTHCKRGHEFTPENTLMENGWRHCVICYRAADRIAAGWPEDLAYSEPKRQGHPPKGLVRLVPEKAPKTPRTHCARGHELIEANVYVTPTGYRQCRRCRTESVYRFVEKIASQSDGAVEAVTGRYPAFDPERGEHGDGVAGLEEIGKVERGV